MASGADDVRATDPAASREDGGHDTLPSMETAAMVGRWKARSLRFAKTVSPASSFIKKNLQAKAPSAAAAEETEEALDGDYRRSLEHGAVRFPGSRLRPAKWARVSHETTMADTLTLITRTWGLPAPSSLISVIGLGGRSGARHSEHLFGPALKRAAETTNAWILTDGAHEGIGGLVGHAVQSLPCIGVQNWTAVAKHELLKPSRTAMMPRGVRHPAGRRTSEPHAPPIKASPRRMRSGP